MLVSALRIISRIIQLNRKQNNMKKTLSIFILLLTAYFTLAAARTIKNETIKIKCPDMHCAGCKEKITEAVNSLVGILELNVDLESKVVTVTYNTKKTSKDKILEKLAEAGYEGEIIS